MIAKDIIHYVCVPESRSGFSLSVRKVDLHLYCGLSPPEKIALYVQCYRNFMDEQAHTTYFASPVGGKIWVLQHHRFRGRPNHVFIDMDDVSNLPAINDLGRIPGGRENKKFWLQVSSAMVGAASFVVTFMNAFLREHLGR